MGIAERRERQKLEMRAQIVRAARAIVLREGFGALTMRKIAEAIEYSPATIYLHFQNRDDIARELSREGFRELVEFLAPVATIADPLERLKGIAAAYVRFGTAHPETYRMIFMQDPQYTTAALSASTHDDPGRQAMLLMTRTIDELKAQGRVASDTPTQQVADVVWTAIHGIVSLKLTCPGFPETPTDVLTETMMRALLYGFLEKHCAPPRTRMTDENHDSLETSL